MKTIGRLLLVTASFIFSQCSSRTDVPPAFNINEENIKLMQEIAPQLVGQWTLSQVHINFETHKLFQGNKLGLTKDTIIQNLAILDIWPASKLRYTPPQLQHPEFEGTIHFKNKRYPIYFYLIPGPRVTTKKGSYAFFLFNYTFPDGMHIPETEETFLEDIGLVFENYSLEVVEANQTMVWKGLNRGVSRINFQKL